MVRHAVRRRQTETVNQEAAAERVVLLSHLSADSMRFDGPGNGLDTCSEASFTSGCDFCPDGHELVSTTTQRRLPRALAVTNTSAPAHLKWCSSCGAASKSGMDCLQAYWTASGAPSAVECNILSRQARGSQVFQVGAQVARLAQRGSHRVGLRLGVQVAVALGNARIAQAQERAHDRVDVRVEHARVEVRARLE